MTIPPWLAPVDVARIASAGAGVGAQLRAQDINRAEAAARLNYSYDALAAQQAQAEAQRAAAESQAAMRLAATREDAAARLAAMSEKNRMDFQANALKAALGEQGRKEKLALDLLNAKNLDEYRRGMLTARQQQVNSQLTGKAAPALVPQYNEQGVLVGYGYGNTFVPAIDKPGLSDADRLLDQRLAAQEKELLDSPAALPIKSRVDPSDKGWTGKTSDLWQELQDIRMERDAILQRTSAPRSRFGGAAAALGSAPGVAGGPTYQPVIDVEATAIPAGPAAPSPAAGTFQIDLGKPDEVQRSASSIADAAATMATMGYSKAQISKGIVESLRMLEQAGATAEQLAQVAEMADKLISEKRKEMRPATTPVQTVSPLDAESAARASIF